MPSNLDRLNALLRDAAVLLAELYPGCRRSRLVTETLDGQEAVLPLPAGRFVPHVEPASPPPALPADEDDALNEKEAAIVTAIRAARGPLTRAEVADAVGRSESGSFCRTMRELVEREILAVDPNGGYRVSEPDED